MSFSPPAVVARRLSRRAISTLNGAAALWVSVALVGQLFFALYVAGFYGGAIAHTNAAARKRLYVPGDLTGDVILGVHLLLAVVILVAGVSQLMPAIRRRAPAVHRWTGRLYISAAMLASIAGLYLVWIRGTVGGRLSNLAVSLNAVLIVTFAILAWRAARARSFTSHRRWALRLFLVANGVWFFRIGFMLWMLAWRRPVGFNPDTFEGPLVVALSLGQTLVPLAILELYFAARERGAWAHVSMAAVLVLLSIATAGGVAGAVAVMWLPRVFQMPR